MHQLVFVDEFLVKTLEGAASERQGGSDQDVQSNPWTSNPSMGTAAQKSELQKGSQCRIYPRSPC